MNSKLCMTLCGVVLAGWIAGAMPAHAALIGTNFKENTWGSTWRSSFDSVYIPASEATSALTAYSPYGGIYAALGYTEGSWAYATYAQTYLEKSFTRAAGDTADYAATLSATVSCGFDLRNIYVLYSTDGGSSWTTQVTVAANNYIDQSGPKSASADIALSSSVSSLLVRWSFENQGNSGFAGPAAFLIDASTSFVAVPEAASLSLLAAGALMTLRARKRS